MTMKIAIANLGNRTGDILEVGTPDGKTTRLRRGEFVELHDNSPFEVRLIPSHASDGEFKDHPNIVIADAPARAW